MKPFLFLAGLSVVLYMFWPAEEVARPAGILAPEEPYTSTFREIHGYRLAPLATFDIRARVIASTRYGFGRAAGLSPVDLVLVGASCSTATF